MSEPAIPVEKSIEMLNAVEKSLNRYFLGKAEVIEMMVISAIASEPLLLVGPPGTGKSDMAVKLVEALGFAHDDYFEYMLTRFTEPSEIFGPIDIELLKAGKYVRRTGGMLPEARIVFLDEVFKANSAILNMLLTVLNEKKFYQDGKPTPVKLEVLFAASNEVPDISELDALKDRFVLKVESRQVWSAASNPQEADSNLLDLLTLGISNEYYAYTGEKPWEGEEDLSGHLRNIRKATFSGLVGQHREETIALTKELFPEPVLHLFYDILKALEMEMPDSVRITDRKVIKLLKLLAVRALFRKRRRINEEDVGRLLACAAERNFAEVKARVQRMIHAG